MKSEKMKMVNQHLQTGNLSVKDSHYFHEFQYYQYLTKQYSCTIIVLFKSNISHKAHYLNHLSIQRS